MRCDVSTLPAATALGGRAFTRQPGGAVTAIARDTLRCEIATTHRGSPHVGEQDPLDLRRQTRRRNDDSFLVQLARARRHAAWRHAAHVGMVRADDAVPADLAVDFDYADEGEIGKVTAAAVGIVENEQV